MKQKESVLGTFESSDYKVIFDSSPNFIIYKDLMGRIVNANKAYVEFLGISKNKVIGMETIDVLKDKKLAQLTLADDFEVIKTGKSKLDQTRKFSSPFSGKEITGLFSKIPYISDSGKIIGTISFIVNITERINAEENLKKAKEDFTNLIQSIPLLVDQVDLKGKFLYWNKYAENMLGYKAEEVIGKLSYFELQENQEKFKKIKETIAQNGKFDGETNLRRKDGSLVLVHLVIISAEEHKIEHGGFYGYAEEITERKKEESLLKESEERLKFALETIYVGAWELDLIDHTAIHSLEHDKVFGYSKPLPKWTYEMFIDFVLPEDREEVDQKFKAAIKNQGDWNFECRIKRADGEIRWIWAVGRHQKDEKGQVRKMAGIVQDITDRKKAEEAVLQRTEELERLNKIMVGRELKMVELKRKIEELTNKPKE